MDNNLRFFFPYLYRMINADGVVSPEELQSMYKIGTENLGLTVKEIDEAVKTAGGTSYKPETAEDKVQLLYYMAQIAWADGKIAEEEKSMLHKYALQFNMDKNKVDKFVDFLLKETNPEIMTDFNDFWNKLK